MTTQTNFSMKPSAVIRGDHLVLNLPDAIHPAVWQFDVARVSAASIDVRQNDQHQYVLRLKAADGNIHDIAVYGTRDAAVYVLSVIHGAFVPAATPGTVQENVMKQETPVSSRRSWIVASIAFIVFVLLVSFLFTGSSTSPTSGVISDSVPAAGVPLPADDVLRGRIP